MKLADFRFELRKNEVMGVCTNADVAVSPRPFSRSESQALAIVSFSSLPSHLVSPLAGPATEILSSLHESASPKLVVRRRRAHSQKLFCIGISYDSVPLIDNLQLPIFVQAFLA